MPSATPGLPPLRADLLLLHPPAAFEFRGRRDIYFPFMGTSGDVPITPLYEYFPIGFKTLEAYLSARGHRVKLLNLASLLLNHPDLELDAVIEALDVRLVGIDLHWMVHVQGSLAIAERIKRLRPELPVVFGGISATYFAAELARYPQIDMVMRGYDTHEPMDHLLAALRAGRPPTEVANLLWTDSDGSVRDNGSSHKPQHFACAADWSSQPAAPAARGMPIRELMTTQNAGCAYDCPWCGGARDAFRRTYACDHAIARKPLDQMRRELATMRALDGIDGYHLYAVGCYNEPDDRLGALLDELAGVDLRSLSIEQFKLPSDALTARMAEANRRTTITLSPQSHDLEVAKRAGRGVFTNEQMEAWLERALSQGIHAVDIWYFVGMPGQDERSVRETVDYCERLLDRFGDRNVNPLICPMIPFLDPGSAIFEQPERFGYRLLYRSAEEHRRAMGRASLMNRLNYETAWLSREDLVRVGFEAVKGLMEARASVGRIPRSMLQRYNGAIDDALAFMTTVHEVDCIAEPAARTRELERLGDEIARRNEMVLFGGVSNQAFPLMRQPSGRWFDELGWPPEVLAPWRRVVGLTTVDTVDTGGDL